MTITPLVDINLITYNHEKFIAKAIESVLEQETDFEYRLIIGDDCSTDNTQHIIREYAEQYPDRIQMLLSPEHRGIEHKQRVGIQVFRLSTAKYVALLDGDDYWTDPTKLQRQIEFLENDMSFSICFHKVNIVYDDGRESVSNDEQAEISTFDDLARRNFIYSVSCMFRNQHWDSLPDFFYQNVAGDWTLHLLNAQYGKIGFIDRTMATYRIHDRGLWGNREPLDMFKKWVAGAENCMHYFNKAHRVSFLKGLLPAYENILEMKMATGAYDDYYTYYAKSLWARICLGEFQPYAAKPHVKRLLYPMVATMRRGLRSLR